MTSLRTELSLIQKETNKILLQNQAHATNAKVRLAVGQLTISTTALIRRQKAIIAIIILNSQIYIIKTNKRQGGSE